MSARALALSGPAARAGGFARPLAAASSVSASRIMERVVGDFRDSEYPDLGQSVSDAIRAAGSAKEVGRLLGRSWRTVQKWQAAETEPPASAILRLMMRSRGAATLLLDRMGFTDAAMDGEQAELVDRLARLRAQRVAAGKTEGNALARAGAALARAEGLKPD